ncbi:hypothetical protein MBLNU457_5035t1 [Dothideomycetes sp. NU457]
MATRKRNEWLEADNSDEELDNGYNSEAQEESRGALAGRSIKRRKVDQESEDEDAFSNDEELDNDPTSRSRFQLAEEDQDDDTEGHTADANRQLEAEAIQANASTLSDLDEDGAQKPSKDHKTLKPLTTRQLERSQKAANKTGVIYLSRVPPFMKPSTLRTYLTPHGETNRIFLTPEDDAQHKRRVRAGGNKKKSYTDGWVEFVSKKDAKMVANVLNGNIIGGRKGSYYYDDVWNIKYLKGFKWHHLTEQISNENAERAAKLRAEISRSRKEDRDFVRDVERGKMIQGIKTKRAARQDGTESSPVADIGAADKDTFEKERRRTFKQNVARSKTEREGNRKEQPEETKRVLSKLF